MSKIDNPKIQAIIYFVTVLVISFILWPLLDFFWISVISHSDFNYNFSDYIIEPLIFTVIMTALFFIPLIRKENKKTKKTKKK